MISFNLTTSSERLHLEPRNLESEKEGELPKVLWL